MKNATQTKFKQINFNSRYFTVHEISLGVYVLLKTEGSPIGANAVFVDMGEGVLLFDTFSFMPATLEALDAIQQIIGKPLKYVVNSHFHTDHILGNAMLLPEIPILSGPITYQKISEYTFKKLQKWKQIAPMEISRLKKQLDNNQEVEKIEDLQWDLQFFQMINNPSFQYRRPNMLFKDKIELVGVKRHIFLVNSGQKHTVEDIYAYLPDDKICFVGDLIFNNLNEIDIGKAVMPFTMDPQSHIELLNELLKLQIETFVCGHGIPGSRSTVEENIKFIKKWYLK